MIDEKTLNRIEPGIQERMLRAFLDYVILRMLKKQAMTAYEIDNEIIRRFSGRRSPNIVYTKLANLEREGYLKCLQSRHGKVYSITDKGIDFVKTGPVLSEKAHSLISLLLNEP
jgi:DNA-binding PadR family transcriptional regulator